MDKKRAEIATLEGQIRDATVYLQALEDTLKMLPREAGDSSDIASKILRAGSKMDRARDAIRTAGRALHVVDLLKAIGEDNTANNRAALSGSLSSYARKGEIFSRTAPNTFGLLELQVRPSAQAGPPPGFGAALPEDDSDADDLSELFGEEEVAPNGPK